MCKMRGVLAGASPYVEKNRADGKRLGPPCYRAVANGVVAIQEHQRFPDGVLEFGQPKVVPKRSRIWMIGVRIHRLFWFFLHVFGHCPDTARTSSLR